MKKKTPPFDKMIEMLIESIKVRHPEEKLDEDKISLLKNQWKGRGAELHSLVKKLAINEHKAQEQSNRVEFREVEFQIGISLSGTPILVKHLVRQENFHTNTKNYKKNPKFSSTLQTKAFVSKTTF